MNKYFVEFMGTFGLTLAVLVSIAGGSAMTPVIAMLTLGLFVYTIGHVSGCHINPAVTAGVWSLGKITSRDAVGYIVAQGLGAVAAMLIGHKFFGAADLGLVAEGALVVGAAEALGMIFFTFGIASVVYGKAKDQMSGIVIGGSLLLGLTIAAIGSNGVLNPAVAYGIGSFNLMYVLGPIVGSIIGMQLYKYLCSDGEM